MENSYSNATIDQIYSHGSIRKYKIDPITNEMVEAIVAAGQRSSTSSNLQTYSVVAVTDKQTREDLATLCGNQEHIRQAPVFLAWCADLNRLDRVCRLRGYELDARFLERFLVAAMDASLAMQTATIAAESLGLGMCYIGAIRNHPREIIELLKIPELVFPVSGMTLGWPDVEPGFRPRLPLEEVLHWESYEENPSSDALLRYDQDMLATGIYRGRQIERPGSGGEMEDYGWLEHSARRVSKSVRVDLSTHVRNQGFEMQ
jgi:FMN reductase (NADPH)